METKIWVFSKLTRFLLGTHNFLIIKYIRVQSTKIVNLTQLLTTEIDLII